jgi:HK97 family phage major capsid protein
MATAVNEPPQRRTVEELTHRLDDVKARMTEIHTEFAGASLPEPERGEFEDLKAEREETERLIEELETRAAWVADEASKPASREAGAHFHSYRADVVRGDAIYDLTTIRASSFGDPEGAIRELHDRAKRSIEAAVFPDDRIDPDRARGHIERLLTRDSDDGELGRLILTTGSPAYRRAFQKYLAGRPLNGEEQRAFALNTTGLPVPYTLDPTVLPVSNSVVNPLRAIASVEQIVGSNEWRGLTAAAVTATRVAENTEATDNAPVLAQPTIPTSKAHAFVPFSIESGQDWAGMDTALARLIADAKDDEEATAFATGNGTPPNPSGVLTGATGTTGAATGLTVTAANLYALEGALAPRFRPRAQFVANRAMYNIIRALDTAGGAQLWLRIGELIPNNPASDGGSGNTGRVDRCRSPSARPQLFAAPGHVSHESVRNQGALHPQGERDDPPAGAGQCPHPAGMAPVHLRGRGKAVHEHDRRARPFIEKRDVDAIVGKALHVVPIARMLGCHGCDARRPGGLWHPGAAAGDTWKRDGRARRRLDLSGAAFRRRHRHQRRHQGRRRESNDGRFVRPRRERTLFARAPFHLLARPLLACPAQPAAGARAFGGPFGHPFERRH